MADLRFIVDETPTISDRIAVWGPRLGVAMLFLGVGWAKFSPEGIWVRIFAAIGFGQWFRLLTGVLQIGGALLVLIPRTAWIGATVLSCTMLGAAFVQLFVLHTGRLSIVPAILMIVTAGVAAQARGWL